MKSENMVITVKSTVMKSKFDKSLVLVPKRIFPVGIFNMLFHKRKFKF